MLDSVNVYPLNEIGEREGVDGSYVSRLVNLTLAESWVIAPLFENKCFT